MTSLLCNFLVKCKFYHIMSVHRCHIMTLEMFFERRNPKRCRQVIVKVLPGLCIPKKNSKG